MQKQVCVYFGEYLTTNPKREYNQEVNFLHLLICVKLQTRFKYK